MRTVFNYVATYNNYERRFAQFLDKAKDVARFSSLGTTQQGDSATRFRVDYLKPSGAIGFYYPDWVVVQKMDRGEINWIIETKGRVWEDTESKDDAIYDWCERVSIAANQTWRFIRVNQSIFDSGKYLTLGSLCEIIGKSDTTEDLFRTGTRIKFWGKQAILDARLELISKRNAWKLETIILKEHAVEVLDQNGWVLTDETVEMLFEGSAFYVSADKKVLAFKSTPFLEKRYGALAKISGVNALREYGIDLIAEAFEKGYIKIR